MTSTNLFNVFGSESSQLPTFIIPKGVSWGDWEDIIDETEKIQINNNPQIKKILEIDNCTNESVWNVVQKRKRRNAIVIKDINKICPTCRESFVFTVEEQMWFMSKGYKPRTICKSCKQDTKNNQRIIQL